MNSAEIDTLLRACVYLEEFKKFSTHDVTVFSVFGTIAPTILQKPHNLIRNSKRCLEGILSLFQTPGALLNRVPPTLAVSQPELEFRRSISAESKAWREEANQRWLLQEVQSLKFTSSRSVIHDACLKDATVELLHSCLDRSQRDDKWFESVETVVNECNWLYIVLPEIVAVDLLTVSTSIAGKVLAELESCECAAEAKWIAGALTFPLDLPEPPIDDLSAGLL